ncbi:MAG TPA: MoxR family ATPase [Sedimentisphaerales bacterium]|nr:MoxR family ATPase [Sedimentisphaerales bacterium]HOV76976.1 MoxR family ATPase [Sedimentisphaerales bacterium]HQG49576.1 MoxR family ATPase [Sedimentisphaerales bacterium]HQI27807.1 MoxR family ATPase [Sedimentisphaerales bacterium]
MTTVRSENPRLAGLKENLQTVIYGKPESIDVVIVALLAGGSILIEDVPGVGKTTLAKALARSIDAKFRRIQFTPDLLPADILGSSIYNPVNGEFRFEPGPIFCNILLADEINRASPRTQSALLEAMNEGQATIEGQRRPLPQPFLVIATENPLEFHGTYPLPEAQLDRFLVRLGIGYPAVEVEVDILKSHTRTEPFEKIEPVLDLEQIRQIQQEVADIHIDDGVLEYMVEIVHTTRHDNRLQLGISTRGTLMLSRAARAHAYYENRDYVIPDDVLWCAPHVLPHRMVLTSKTRYGGSTAKQIVADIISRIKVPV